MARTVLRNVGPLVFGLGMSLNPLLAAVLGAVPRREEIDRLGWAEVVRVLLSNGLTLPGVGPLSAGAQASTGV